MPGSSQMPQGTVSTSEYCPSDQIGQQGNSIPNKQTRIECSQILSQTFLQLFLLCTRRKWSIRARHILGHLNAWADALSRNLPIKSEWELCPLSFSSITKPFFLK